MDRTPIFGQRKTKIPSFEIWLALNYRTDEIDFSPFNADEVLKALCSVLRTSKHLSFSYAGDIQSLIDRIGRTFYAARSMIFLSGSDDGQQVEIFEYVKRGKTAVAHEFASPFGQKMARHLLTLPQEVHLVEDVDKFSEEIDEGFRDMFKKIMEAVGKERVYLIPLRLLPPDSAGTKGPERRAGLLLLQEIDSSSQTKWNKLVVESLVTIADHLAKLFEVESLRGRLEAHESEDPATGFLNRRGGVLAITEEIERSRFFGDRLSLMLIHVDSAKKSDAPMGAAQAKAVLTAVSGVVSSQSRPVDVICRFGHEEYIVALPRMSREEAVRVAQQIKSSVGAALLNVLEKGKQEKHGQPYDGDQEGLKSQPLTVSIGIASMPEDGNKFDDLLCACHELISEAKCMGGNQVKSRS